MAVACLGAVILLVGCRGGHPAHPLPDDRTLSFVFYNVENLYDLIDDPQTNDEEYLPSGKKKWNEEKYRKKLADLSSVLAELGGDELPEIIGLCEVENRQVVQDLVAREVIAALVRELALQSQLVARTESSWTLRVEKESLANPGSRERLQAALADAGYGVKLSVDVGPVSDSPSRRNAIVAASKQKAAHELLLADPFVQEMIRDFGAKIVPGSVKSL